MSRMLPILIPLVVQADDDNTPLSFLWLDKQGHIHSIENRWRIEKDWWHEPIARDYFFVVVDDSYLATIFYDRIQQTWHFQRLYD